MLVLCGMLQSPGFGGRYCCVDYCSLQVLVVLLCALLQSPGFGGSIVWAAAVSMF